MKNTKNNNGLEESKSNDNLEDLEKRLMSRAANLKERFGNQEKASRKKTYTNPSKEFPAKKDSDTSFKKKFGTDNPKSNFDNSSFEKPAYKPRVALNPKFTNKPQDKRNSYSKDSKFESKGKFTFEKKSFVNNKSSDSTDKKSFDNSSRKPFEAKNNSTEAPRKSALGYEKKKFEKKPFEKNPFVHKEFYDNNEKPVSKKSPIKKDTTKRTSVHEPDSMRLNKYIAMCGIAARRKADELISQGAVKVNNTVVTEMGFRVTKKDVIQFNNKVVKPTEKFIYILLNKPKDTLTTVSDDRGRNTIMDYIQVDGAARVYPVGRLDRNTTGVLLITNDGDLAQHITHPSSMTEKIYEIQLDRPLTKIDYETIAAGIELEDGFIKPDNIAFPDNKDKSVVGIEIHSGRNRIVRRIFESLNYNIEKLDRVVFAGLTKKNLSRGKWRHLNEKEIIMLKHFTKS